MSVIRDARSMGRRLNAAREQWIRWVEKPAQAIARAGIPSAEKWIPKRGRCKKEQWKEIHRAARQKYQQREKTGEAVMA